VTAVQILGVACLALGAATGWFINRVFECKEELRHWQGRCHEAERLERIAESEAYRANRERNRRVYK
jgi:predicted ATP-dependent serine protease